MTIIGGTALGFASANATGAFDRIEFDRDVTISVDGDMGTYLTVRPSSERSEATYGPEVDHDEETDEIYIDFGDPINSGSTIDFDNMLIVTNSGGQDVSLSVEFLSGDTIVPDALSIYIEDDPEQDSVVIAPNGTVTIGMRIDASDGDAVDSVDTMRFIATSV